MTIFTIGFGLLEGFVAYQDNQIPFILRISTE